MIPEGTELVIDSINTNVARISPNVLEHEHMAYTQIFMHAKGDNGFPADNTRMGSQHRIDIVLNCFSSKYYTKIAARFHYVSPDQALNKFSDLLEIKPEE